MKYDGLNGFSVYCSFRREVHICSRLARRVRNSWFCVCVCVLCLRLGDSISSSISQSSGRETGELSFSLVYFAAVACWHISIPSSMSGTKQHVEAWPGPGRHLSRNLPCAESLENPIPWCLPLVCTFYLVPDQKDVPHVLVEWRWFTQLFNMTLDIEWRW